MTDPNQDSTSAGARSEGARSKEAVDGRHSVMGSALSAGLTAGVSIALFTLAGRWLDDRYDTEPLFIVVLALAGVAGGMIHLLHSMGAIGRNRRRARPVDDQPEGKPPGN